jgi:AhpD family alkylhydroperoxidase
MARLPYADLSAPEGKPLVDRIVRERGSVLHLYQMLLHSPPVAEGWLTYLTAIRQKGLLSAALRELVIMRVAVINGAPYEAQQHAPIALKEGVTQAQLDDLANWEASERYTPQQRAVLHLTDGMTKNVQVPNDAVAAVREFLSDREVVELVATVGAYNMVSRFLEALDIHSDDQRS